MRYIRTVADAAVLLFFTRVYRHDLFAFLCQMCSEALILPDFLPFFTALLPCADFTKIRKIFGTYAKLIFPCGHGMLKTECMVYKT